MLLRSWLGGCVLSVTLGCLLLSDAAATPILEFQFNETGSVVQSSGTAANEAAYTYYGFLGQPGKTSVDLHTAEGLGVGGDLIGNVNYGTDRALQGYYGEVINPDTQTPSTVQVIALNETSTAVSSLPQWTVSGWYKLNDNEDAALLGGTPFFQAPGSSAVFNSQGFAVRAQWNGDIRVTANSYQFSNQLSSDVMTFEPKGVWVYFAVSYDGNSSVDNVKIYQGFRNTSEAVDASQQVGVPLNAGVTLMDTLTIDSGPIEASVGYSMLGRMVESDKINNPGVYDSVYHWQDAIYDNIRVDGGILDATALDLYRSTDAFGFTAVPADTDSDGDVDTADLTTMFQNFTGDGGTGKTKMQGDTDLDGDVDTADITVGLQSFTGAAAGLADNPDIIYDPATGNVKIDADGANIGSFNLQSAGQFSGTAVFTDLAADTGFPSGPTDNTASAVGWVSGGSLFGTGFDGPGLADLGNILPTGLDVAGLTSLLTNKAWAAPIGGGSGGNFDLTVVPEPSSILLALLGSLSLLVMRRRRRIAA